MRPDRRRVRTLVRSLLLMLMLLVVPPLQAEPTDLVLLTWPDYLSPDVVRRFEERFNARILTSHFDQDADRSERLLETEGRGFDLITVSGSDLAIYARRGWLEPLDTRHLPNLRHIAPRWLDAFASARQFGVPYFWGTVGIAYRQDLVPEPILSWSQLFQPAPGLRGKISMVSDPRDLLGAALKSLGYSLNSQSLLELKEAGALLGRQKPYTKTYAYTPLNEQAPLVTGEVVAGLLYNGDALALKVLQPELQFVVPLEGGNLWVDYWTVARHSRNKTLAYQFLDFINEPANAAQQARELFYATPNQSAEMMLPREVLNNPVIYPSTATLEASEFYQPLSPRTLKLRNEIFLSITE